MASALITSPPIYLAISMATNDFPFNILVKDKIHHVLQLPLLYNLEKAFDISMNQPRYIF